MVIRLYSWELELEKLSVGQHRNGNYKNLSSMLGNVKKERTIAHLMKIICLPKMRKKYKCKFLCNLEYFLKIRTNLKLQV